MSQITAMAERLQDAERAVTELQAMLRDRPEAARESLAPHAFPESHAASSVTANFMSDTNAAAPSPNDEGPSEDRLLSDLSLDANGSLCYYGPTSAVYAPVGSDQMPGNSPGSNTRSSRAQLASNAIQARTWEDFALGNAAVQTGIPQTLLSRLLHIHWTWVAPMFMWVYRPAFMSESNPPLHLSIQY